MMDHIEVTGSRPWTDRRGFNPRWLGLALALAGIAAPGLAAAAKLDPLPVTTVVDNSRAPALAPSLAVGVWTSEAGETKDAFVQRVGAELTRYTKAHGVEVCGMLMKARAGEGWRLPVTTSASHLGCIVVALDDADYEVINESVHTHPYLHSVHPSVEDVAIAPNRGFSVGGYRQYIDPDHFSEPDYRAGPGYVIVPPSSPFGDPQVLYQDGLATERVIGNVKGDRAPADPDERWTAMTEVHDLPSRLGVATRRSGP